MTAPEPLPLRRFPANTLPWVVAATALAVYAFTLNPWVSFGNLTQVARVSGWLMEPELTQPLYYLVTLPVRAMPAAWAPAALNLLNAILAAAVLGLLVRSVALLPHDRTHEQRLREEHPDGLLSFRSAWLPPALAAAVCGLQLTFWEHATTGTTEMLNLLVFAYIIRCLLEFRISQRPHWLWQAALLWGAGMANNFAMLGFLPAFVVSVLWLKRARFFELRFLGTMLALGLAGMSLYVLMPLLTQFDATQDLGFWQSFKQVVLSQKNALLSFPKKTVAVLALSSVLPVLFIGIKWPKAFGDVTPAGEFVSTWVIHLVHALFFVVGLWIAFDSPASPRNAKLGVPFLTFYYLGALAIGYFAGYFILVFGQPTSDPKFGTSYGRRPKVRVLDRLVPPAVWVLAAVVTVGLAWRTLPQIRITNSNMVRDYAALLGELLPKSPTVVYSDEPVRELLLRAWLAQQGPGHEVMVVNTFMLNYPQYHAWMAARHPDRWPMPLPEDMRSAVAPVALIQLARAFHSSNELYYAHPSFGYYFESFLVEPQGLTSRLVPYQPEEILAPPLSDTLIQTNLEFWERAERLLESVRTGMEFRRQNGPAEGGNKLIAKLHLVNEANPTATALGNVLSRSLNVWGVQLQRAERVKEAADCFAWATALNPENAPAVINAQFNADLQAGRPSTVEVTRRLEAIFDKYRGDEGVVWSQVVNANGHFDEPGFTLLMAETFQRGGLLRQAIQEFDRVRTLTPDNYLAQLWYARLLSALGDPAASLRVVDDIRASTNRFTLTSTNRLELLFVEASAHLARKEVDTAVTLLQEAVSAAPANTNLATAALQFYMNAGLFTNALSLLDRRIAQNPQEINALVNKGFLLIQLTNYTEAVEVLSQALAVNSESAPARLNRAISYLRLNELDKAKEDYEVLVLQNPKAHPIYYGLGEIAWRRHDTNNAIYNYRLYLSNAPPRSPERQEVLQRLEQLTSAQP